MDICKKRRLKMKMTAFSIFIYYKTCGRFQNFKNEKYSGGITNDIYYCKNID